MVELLDDTVVPWERGCLHSSAGGALGPPNGKDAKIAKMRGGLTPNCSRVSWVSTPRDRGEQ